MSVADAKAMRFYTTRSAGQLYTGPMSRGDSKPTVMEITAREMVFADSDSALRFMDAVGSKQRSRNTACGSRKLKQMAAADND